MRKPSALALVIVLQCCAVICRGQPAPDAGDTAADAAAAKLTVAVLRFDADAIGQADLGPQMAEVLSIMLSVEPGFDIVERQTLDEVLAEQQLNLTGLVDAEEAVRVGKLVGAKIIITGRVFQLGENLFVTAKLVGTETSLVEGVLIRTEGGADLGDLAPALAEQVGTRLREAGPGLVAQPELRIDPIVELKQRLEGRDLPTMAVVIREQHHAEPRPVRRAVIDPAVETEFKRVLIEAGFTVRDVPANELADFAASLKAGDAGAWPRSLDGVDIVIAGEAFSEFGTRIANLVSASARAEVNAISRADGRIILAERVTRRAVDLSENIAGKTALQAAGRECAIRFLRMIADQPAP